MMNESIFEVTREDYKAFVERLIPGMGEVKEEELDRWTMATKIYSKRTGKCWCSRVCKKEEKEKYFIFEYPDDDEWGPPVPKMKITLETKEEVQALFDALAELRKQQNG